MVDRPPGAPNEDEHTLPDADDATRDDDDDWVGPPPSFAGASAPAPEPAATTTTSVRQPIGEQVAGRRLLVFSVVCVLVALGFAVRAWTEDEDVWVAQSGEWQAAFPTVPTARVDDTSAVNVWESEQRDVQLGVATAGERGSGHQRLLAWLERTAGCKLAPPTTSGLVVGRGAGGLVRAVLFDGADFDGIAYSVHPDRARAMTAAEVRFFASLASRGGWGMRAVDIEPAALDELMARAAAATAAAD